MQTSYGILHTFLVSMIRFDIHNYKPFRISLVAGTVGASVGVIGALAGMIVAFVLFGLLLLW